MFRLHAGDSRSHLIRRDTQAKRLCQTAAAQQIEARMRQGSTMYAAQQSSILRRTAIILLAARSHTLRRKAVVWRTLACCGAQEYAAVRSNMLRRTAVCAVSITAQQLCGAFTRGTLHRSAVARKHAFVGVPETLSSVSHLNLPCCVALRLQMQMCARARTHTCFRAAAFQHYYICASGSRLQSASRRCCIPRRGVTYTAPTYTAVLPRIHAMLRR